MTLSNNNFAAERLEKNSSVNRASVEKIPRLVQRRLDLRAADGSRLLFVRPMLGMESVKALLDVSEDDVLDLIAEGQLRWAWNLSASAGPRSFVRVWSRSVTCYLVPGSQPAEPDTLDEVIEQLLGSRISDLGARAPDAKRQTPEPTLRATALQRVFNVSSGHVLNLLAAGPLKLAPRCDWHKGVSPEITRASVVELLKGRSL